MGVDDAGGLVSGSVTITGIVPAQGSLAGTRSVRISGTGFDSSAQVFFGSAASTSVSFVSATELHALPPAVAAAQPATFREVEQHATEDDFKRRA